MKLRNLILVLIFLTGTHLTAQTESHELSIQINFGEEIQQNFHNSGRLFVFLNKDSRGEPRYRTWPSAGNNIFARNFEQVDPTKTLNSINTADWSRTSTWSLKEVPEGEYYIQVLWDWDTVESNINAPGNFYSVPAKVLVDNSKSVKITMDKTIEAPKLSTHELVKYVNYKSDTLSSWWGKDVFVKAGILLPKNYHKNPTKKYPVRYNVAGYGGRYTRVSYTVQNKKFLDWWLSDDAPEVINVYLDGEGPFGDSYQMDSDNSGPYGYNLINELIPYIENKYRGLNDPEKRFVDGCSTGGWVSLGLQLYYPDSFNGCYSYSPDAIEFENYQLINIYKDKNAYTNEFGYLRPVSRQINGEPTMSLKDFINYENVLGSSNSYVTSGGQFSAHTALYSPKGADGLPSPLFNPESGDLDAGVAEHWKKYDFKLYAKENWEELGPKLQGKIYIWMGDMDHFYLNPATRAFNKFIETTENPKSDAVIEFSAMEGHCSKFDQKAILKMIQAKLSQ